MDFKLLTDDVLQTILTIRGSSITDEKITVELGPDSFIMPNTVSSFIGYFVSSGTSLDIDDSIGTLGTLQMPVNGTFGAGTPSIADLNGFFGNFEGAHGMLGQGTTRSIYIKTELAGGDWARFEVSSYITS